MLIEPTSGNTGIGLAFFAASRGYRLIVTLPESVSVERRKLLAYLGAELELTPKEKGMKGAVARAQELLEATPGAVIVGQFTNPANPEIHRLTTAEEIWFDTDGRGGHRGLRHRHRRHADRHRPGAEAAQAGAEADRGGADARARCCPAARPRRTRSRASAPGFVPAVLDTSLIDEIVQVTNEETFAQARRLARSEGIPGGISSGAALAATLKVAKRPENAGKLIVAIIPSFAERYYTTALFEGL